MDMTKLKEACTLQELTGQESGIVIYCDTAHCYRVIVVNWSGLDEYELPVAFEFSANPFGWRYGEWTVDDVHDVDDIRDELPGTIDISKNDDGTLSAQCTMEILLDRNGEIPALYGIDVESGTFSQPEPVSGRCYRLSLPEEMEVMVIAPKDWA